MSPTRFLEDGWYERGMGFNREMGYALVDGMSSHRPNWVDHRVLSHMNALDASWCLNCLVGHLHAFLTALFN